MKRPNILIFMTDQQQAAIIDPSHPCQVPNMTRLSNEGVRFTETFTTMAHCCPSRATFMTGLYPSQHGIHNNVSTATAINRSLKPGVETFGEQLKAAGYSMHFTGKWHVSGVENPADRGWDELIVRNRAGDVSDPCNDKWKRMPQNYGMEERLPGHIRRPGWGGYRLYAVDDEPDSIVRDQEVIDSAVHRLQELASEESESPWCMYVGVNGPHDPFVVPEHYVKLYNAEDIELPCNYSDTLADKTGLTRRQRQVWDQLTEGEVREATAHYWGYCTLVDEWLGQVLDVLESTGQSEDTMVVFLSDHGESLGAHGLFLKGLTPYDETYRVPCIVRWPGASLKPGTVVSELVSMMDFAPTFLELAGLGEIEESKGRSLLQLLRGHTDPLSAWRDAVFTQCNGLEVYYTQRIVRTKGYKFVYNPTDVDELYDLIKDPYELINLANHDEYLHIVEEMCNRMWREMADVNDTIFNDYPTVSTALFGPALAIGKI